MGKLNMDLVRKQKQTMERQNNSFDKLAVGNNLRRILWPKGDSEEISSEGWMHFGLGEDKRSSIACCKTHNAYSSCPICSFIERLQKSGNDEDKSLAMALKARKRVFYNVIDRDDTESKDAVKIMACGTSVQKQIIQILCDPEYGDITDYNEGCDITIKRTGQSLNTEYSILPKRNKSVASATLSMEELEEKMTDLDSLWSIPTPEEAKQMLIDSGLMDDSGAPALTEPHKSSETQYEQMTIDELEALCNERGLPIPERKSKYRLVVLLTEDDEESRDEGDSVKESISNALNRRK